MGICNELNYSFDRLLLNNDADDIDPAFLENGTLRNCDIMSDFDTEDDFGEDDEKEYSDSDMWTTNVEEMNDLRIVDHWWGHDGINRSSLTHPYLP